MCVSPSGIVRLIAMSRCSSIQNLSASPACSSDVTLSLRGPFSMLDEAFSKA